MSATMPPPIEPFVAAKTVGEISAWQLSNLQMQKILYLAQMFYMGENGGVRLINAFFEAWDYGPVLPVLYHELKYFGNQPVEASAFAQYDTVQDEEQRSVIQASVEVFGNLGVSTLIAITHKKNSAWQKNYEKGVRGITIPDHDILEEYNCLVAETKHDKAREHAGG